MTVVPAAITLPAPAETGAMKLVLQPMKARSPDPGAELLFPVIVGGHHAAAHIDFLSYIAVPQVAQMGHRGLFADPGVLDLHKVADLGAGSDAAAGRRRA